MDALHERLARLVATASGDRLSVAAIDDATPILGPGSDLESLVVLEIVVALEEQMGVVLGEGEVGPEQMATFGHLKATVQARLGDG